MKVLIAEDNHFYRVALESAIREWGYDVIAVADGQAAWNVLSQEPAPKLAVLDWVMPGLEGIEVCRRLRALPRHEPTYVLMLTSKDGRENAVAALESGADDYIVKPFDRAELKARLRVGARIVGLQTSETVVFAFARAVEAKSPYTRGHSDRVTRYAVALAEHVGESSADCDRLRRGALLHDIGKICVPDAILNKPGPLTREEYEVMKQHPEHGAQIVQPLEALQEVIPLIRWHHERLDGRGYPDGLSGDAIPRLVRILSVADVYDALASERPYRPGLPHTECVAQLKKDVAGGALDGALVDAFCAMMPAGQPQPVPEIVPVLAAPSRPVLYRPQCFVPRS
jgi:putative two-component system response regulator